MGSGNADAGTEIGASASLYSLRVLGTAAGILLALPQLLLARFTCDDAFISFRYLLQLRAGFGLVFNPGERVEGFSHPLYIVALLPALLFPDAATALLVLSKTLGLLCTMCTLWLLLGMVRAMRLDLLSAIIAVGLYIVAPGTYVYASAGMETSLMTCLLLLALRTAAAGDKNRTWIPGLLLGAAAVTRPEGILYGAGWLAVICLEQETPRRAIRAASGAAAWLLPVVVYEVFRLSYFGEWVPNTFFAKPPGTFGGKLGIPYMAPFAAAVCLPIAALGCMTVQRAERLCAVWCAAALVFVCYTRGDWMPFGRLLMPAWPLAALLAARGFCSLQLPQRRAVVAATLVPATAALVLWQPVPAYLRGDGLNKLMHGRSQLAAGDWLAQRMAPGETAATVRLGGLAYRLPQHKIFDMAGLTDREIAQHMWRSGGTVDWAGNPAALREPDWIAVVHAKRQEFYHDDPALTQCAKTDYVLAGTLAQPPDEEWLFFRRKSK